MLLFFSLFLYLQCSALECTESTESNVEYVSRVLVLGIALDVYIYIVLLNL